VAPGEYSVSESPVDGWDLTGATCDLVGTVLVEDVDPADLTVGAGETWLCTFTNTEKGSITIVKVAQGGSGTAFDFDGPDQDPGSDLTLTPTTPTGNPNEFSAQDVRAVAPGTYPWRELVPPAGWVFVTVKCDNGSSTDQEERSADISVAAGEDVTCSWTNAKRPSVTVNKSSTPGGGGPFTFNLSGPGLGPDGVDKNVSGGGSVSWGAPDQSLEPEGDYTLIEEPDSDWVQAFGSCTYTIDGGQSQPIGTPLQ
jgi:hypothetical protein